MKKPPAQDCRCHNEQPEYLVASKRKPLRLASLFFRNLLLIRLDPAFDHSAPRISIGAAQPGEAL